MLAVTKAEFDSRFFKDFQDYMIAMYLKKKKQRDIAVENVKKEYESKASEIKAKNIYTVQNTRIKDIIKKPALQSLSKYMHREHKTVDSMDPVRQLILSKNNANTHLDTSMLFTRVSADE